MTTEKKTGTTKSKYKNQRTLIAGVWWDSKKEYQRWLTLWSLQKAGLIRDLKRQVRFPIKINGQLVCTFIADFCYVKGREYVVEDTKSEFTRTLPVFRIKSKLMRAVWGIVIREV